MTKMEREVRDLLHQGGVLIDSHRYDGTKAVIPARTHRMAGAIELGSRIRPLGEET